MKTALRPLNRHAPLTPYHQFELDRVVKVASARVAVMPGVDAFEIAPMKGGAHHRESQTEIRAKLADESHGIEFRYNLPLRQSRCGSINDIAWDIVGRAHQFLVDPKSTDHAVAARDAIAPIVAAATAASLPPRLAAVGVSYEFEVKAPRICADIEMLGDDLAMGVERVFGFDVDHLKREVARYVEDHDKRVNVRIHAERTRASGWVDQAALRLIDAAGLSRQETIKLVVREGLVNFNFPGNGGDHFYATLSQTHGVITGWVMPQDRRWGLKHGDLIFWSEDMPNVLRDSLTGRRVGNVFQNTVLPADALIGIVSEVTSVDPESDDDEIDGWLRLTLDIPVAEIDQASGEPRSGWSPSIDRRDAMKNEPARMADPALLAVTDISSARTPGQFRLTIEPDRQWVQHEVVAWSVGLRWLTFVFHNTVHDLFSPPFVEERDVEYLEAVEQPAMQDWMQHHLRRHDEMHEAALLHGLTPGGANDLPVERFLIDRLLRDGRTRGHRRPWTCGGNRQRRRLHPVPRQ